VLGPLYWKEPLSRRVERLVGSSREIPAVSLLGEVELFSAVAKRQRAGDLSLADARRIAREFESHLEAGAYRRLAVEPEHFVRARELIGRFETALRALDALHVCIAGAHGLRLATADRALARAAKALGLDCLYLR
jgi:predicted nucleic acid-binding protein